MWSPSPPFHRQLVFADSTSAGVLQRPMSPHIQTSPGGGQVHARKSSRLWHAERTAGILDKIRSTEESTGAQFGSWVFLHRMRICVSDAVNADFEHRKTSISMKKRLFSIATNPTHLSRTLENLKWRYESTSVHSEIRLLSRQPAAYWL